MASFRNALKGVRESIAALGDGSLIDSISVEDGSSVIVKLKTGPRVSILISSVDDYPSCGAVVWCEQPELEPALSTVSERFQDRCPLPAVIQKVLSVLGHDVDLGSRDRDASATVDTLMADQEEESAPSGGGSDSDGQNDMDDDSDYDGGYGGSGDGDGDDGGDSEESDEEDKALTIDCGTRLGRWTRYEASLEQKKQDSKLSADQGLAAKRQIFNPKEAFTMLSNELIALIKAQADSMEMIVDAINDDVYHWIVELPVDPSSPLGKDMEAISRRYKYSSLQLSITYMRGLHPFYPPSVEVLRPHLCRPLLSAVASHPMLTLEKWDPWRPQADLIRQIKTFLEAAARVDLNSPLNDISAHPQSCYSLLQRSTARLEALAGVEPLCAAKYKEVYTAREAYQQDMARIQALNESKKRSRDDDSSMVTALAAAAAPPTAGAAAAAAAEAMAALATATGGAASAAATVGAAGVAAAAPAAGAAAAAPPAGGAAAAPAVGGGAMAVVLALQAAQAQAAAIPPAATQPAAVQPAPAAQPAKKEVVWAKGTGYGYGAGLKDGPVWDPKAAEQAQAAKDAELLRVMQAMRKALQEELGSRDKTQREVDDDAATGAAATATTGTTATAATAGAAGAGAGAAGAGGGAGSGSGDCAQATTGMEGLEGPGAAGPSGTQQQDTAAGGSSSGNVSATLIGAEATLEELQSSCLVPFLVRELSMSSLADIASRSPYYTALLELLRELCRPSTLHLLQWPCWELAQALLAQQPLQLQAAAGSGTTRTTTETTTGTAASRGATASSSALQAGPSSSSSASGSGGSSSAGGSGVSSGPALEDVLAKSLRPAASRYLAVLQSDPRQQQQQASTSTSASAANNTATTTAAAAAGPGARRLPEIQSKVQIAAETAAKEAEATSRLSRIIMHICDYLKAHPLPPEELARRQAHQKQANSLLAAAAAAAVGTSRLAAASGTEGTASAAASGPCTPASVSEAPSPSAATAGLEGAIAAEPAAALTGAEPSTSAGDRQAKQQAADAALKEYERVMKPLQVDLVSGISGSYHYASTINNEQVAPRTRAVRLAKEVASLENMLPLHPGSSVFVRVDETKVQCWKAIIVGPEDTPYSGGMFVFDIYFPPQYPSVPPQVNLQTTGGGSVRFNPNLYNCGKVCLSLLGTWQGNKGEQWQADVSTANQVLWSIQSLILVPDPYFNEPSYETSYNTPDGRQKSRQYNEKIREGTLRYAMLEQLRHPPREFEQVVRHHFRLRAQTIMDTVNRWIAEAEEHKQTQHKNELVRHNAALQPLLAAL